jgi:ABC-type transport system involved in multi-copper enzyme maturation permease subunit
MTKLVLAELGKARATRSVLAMLAVGVAFCAAWAAVSVLAFHDPLTDSYAMAQQGYLFALLIGILVTAGEYRHRTITWALLITPRRGRVVAAKLVACGLIGLGLGLASVVVTTPVTAVLLAVVHRPVFAASVPGALLGAVVSTVLWAVFGAALGLLIRNQVAAIIAAFAWFLYAEWFLVLLLPSVGRWTPTGLSKAIAGWSRTGLSVPGALLPAWLAGIVFLAYTVVAALAARSLSVRRDVT